MQVNSSGTGEVMDQLAGPHLWAAAYFPRAAHGLEQEGLKASGPASFYDETRYNVNAAVFAAVAAVEAWVGDLTSVGFRRTTCPGVSDAQIDKIRQSSSALGKVSDLGVLLGKPKVDSTSDPEMFDLVFLRNKLVHFEAEPHHSRSVHTKVDAALASRFGRSPLLDATAPFFPEAYASHACARWAVETAQKFIERIAAERGWPIEFITKVSHQERLKLV